MTTVKINSILSENVKRLKLVELDCTDNSLVLIGGNNGEGKTSILDSIAFALGGAKFKPSKLVNESADKMAVTVELSNGMTIERYGKDGGQLKISGAKGKQADLNEVINLFALNVPAFMDASTKEKAKMLLSIIGVGDQLQQLDEKEKELFDERYSIGRDADRKAKYADEMAFFEEVGHTPLSPSEIMEELQTAVNHNAKFDQILSSAEEVKSNIQMTNVKIDGRRRRIEELTESIKAMKTEVTELETHRDELKTVHDRAMQESKEFKGIDTTELQTKLKNLEDTNAKIRQNLDKEKASEDAETLKNDYRALTEQIETIRQERIELLNSANLPLPELSVEKGELLYRGQKWDCMSGSEQLKVAASIVHAIKPDCGFVLLDKLEQMDTKTLAEFATWLETRDLQVIGTIVSTGDECSVIIENGEVKEDRLISGTTTENLDDEDF